MPLEKLEPQSSLASTQLLDLLLPSVQAALERILHLGIEEAPNEACGLLVNEFEGVRVVKMINRATNPVNGYVLDASTIRQLATQRQWSHVAVWHTHPGGLVGPSSGDLEHKVPNVKYVVVTVPTGEAVWF